MRDTTYACKIAVPDSLTWKCDMMSNEFPMDDMRSGLRFAIDFCRVKTIILIPGRASNLGTGNQVRAIFG